MDRASRGDATASSQLDPRIADSIDFALGTITSLSRRYAALARLGGLSSEDIANIENNASDGGSYIERTFRFFDDQAYADDIRQKPHFNEIAEKMFPARASGGIDGSRNDLVVYLTGLRGDAVRVGALLGDTPEARVDPMVFDNTLERLQLTDKYRALLGEHRSAPLNLARTEFNLRILVSQAESMLAVRTLLIEEGLISQGGALRTASRPEHRVPLAKESHFKFFNGYSTTPEVAEMIKEYSEQQDQVSTLSRVLFVAMAASKAANTVFSLPVVVGNLLGQPFFSVLNGHLPNRFFLHSVISAWRSQLGGPLDSNYWSADRYRQLGLLGPGAVGADIDSALDYIRSSKSKEAARKALKPGADIYKLAGILYNIPDVINRLNGFHSELNALRASFPEMLQLEAERARLSGEFVPTKEELEAEAARRVRNTYPTQRQMPKLMNSIKGLRVVAPYIWFFWELQRNISHNINYAFSDLRSGNPALAKHGARRLAGVILAGSSMGLIKNLVELLLKSDVSDEEERLYRKGLPSSQRNQDLVFLPSEAGTTTAWNPNNIFPFGQLTSVLRGLKSELAGDNGSPQYVRALTTAALNYISPFIQREQTLKALFEIQSNKDSHGRFIYDPSDASAAFDASRYFFYNSFMFGTAKRFLENIVPAIQGQTRKGPTVISPESEIVSELGFKTRKVDQKAALGYAVKAVTERTQELEYSFRKFAIGKEGSVRGATDKQIIDEYLKTERKRFGLFSGLHATVLANYKIGMTEDDVFKIIRELEWTGLNYAERRGIVEGYYIPTALSPDFRSDYYRKYRKPLPPEIFVKPRTPARLSKSAVGFK